MKKKPTHEEEKIEKINSEKLRSILKLLRSKSLKGVEFKKGRGKISFSAEIESDPQSAKDWLFHILVIPDLSEDDHDHFMLDEKEMRQVRNYLDRLLAKIDTLKNKTKKRNLRGT